MVRVPELKRKESRTSNVTYRKELHRLASSLLHVLTYKSIKRSRDDVPIIVFKIYDSSKDGSLETIRIKGEIDN
ncbi:hypothetical protein P9112_010021 [Eukaryota sp. TZLM1-RC]